MLKRQLFQCHCTVTQLLHCHNTGPPEAVNVILCERVNFPPDKATHREREGMSEGGAERKLAALLRRTTEIHNDDDSQQKSVTDINVRTKIFYVASKGGRH
ncbi:hypothetical protein ILYODFUR_035783 [Ilyodon furcidens]|uniref:Uncharacterized protein n=1 Tax=Ilyodon furcidens TaxID=33524 RepID=A0ABV0SRW2_9TELE